MGLEHWRRAAPGHRGNHHQLVDCRARSVLGQPGRMLAAMPMPWLTPGGGIGHRPTATAAARARKLPEFGDSTPYGPHLTVGNAAFLISLRVSGITPIVGICACCHRFTRRSSEDGTICPAARNPDRNRCAVHGKFRAERQAFPPNRIERPRDRSSGAGYRRVGGKALSAIAALVAGGLLMADPDRSFRWGLAGGHVYRCEQHDSLVSGRVPSIGYP